MMAREDENPANGSSAKQANGEKQGSDGRNAIQRWKEPS
jgi:hypothetical protein